jgi:hypothetical protein
MLIGLAIVTGDHDRPSGAPKPGTPSTTTPGIGSLNLPEVATAWNSGCA